MIQWVSAAVKFTLKNPPKGHRGLRGANYTIGKNRPTDLQQLIFDFTVEATDFYAEVMPEVSNQDIACQIKDACRKILESLEVPEEKVE